MWRAFKGCTLHSSLYCDVSRDTPSPWSDTPQPEASPYTTSWSSHPIGTHLTFHISSNSPKEKQRGGRFSSPPYNCSCWMRRKWLLSLLFLTAGKEQSFPYSFQLLLTVPWGAQALRHLGSSGEHPLCCSMSAHAESSRPQPPLQQLPRSQIWYYEHIMAAVAIILQNCAQGLWASHQKAL